MLVSSAATIVDVGTTPGVGSAVLLLFKVETGSLTIADPATAGPIGGVLFKVVTVAAGAGPF